MEKERQKIEISVTHVGGLRGQTCVYIDGRQAATTVVPVAVLDEIQKFADFIESTINNQ